MGIYDGIDYIGKGDRMAKKRYKGIQIRKHLIQILRKLPLCNLNLLQIAALCLTNNRMKMRFRATRCTYHNSDLRLRCRER